MKKCEPAIYELLKGLAGGRVYRHRAPQALATSFIVFQRVDGDRWRHINGPTGIAQAYIQIDCYAATAEAVDALSMAVESLLDGFSGLVYYGSASPTLSIRIGGISLQHEFETLDQTDSPLLVRNVSTYLVTYNQGD